MKGLPGARATSPANDAEIMRRLAQGESGALGQLYDRYQERGPAVRCSRHVRRRGRGRPGARDLSLAGKSAARYDGRA